MIKKEKQLEIMQEFLPTFRKIGDLTINDIVNYTGISRQGYINLEKKTAKLSVYQYATLRLLFDYISEKNKNITLGAIVELLLDKNETSEIREIKESITSETYAKQPKKDMIKNINYILMSSVAMGMIPLVGPALIGLATVASKKQKEKNNIPIKPWVENLFD